MTPQLSFLFSSIALSLASVCLALTFWTFLRLSRAESNLVALDVKLPPVRITDLEASFDGLSATFATLEQKNLEWKQSVHNSVQRLDQVMRRNEKAAAELLTQDGSLNDDVVPGEFPEESVTDAKATNVRISKQAALRKKYNANRGT